jgi:pimeloyl-ACP methyl ester carboxylesterase
MSLSKPSPAAFKVHIWPFPPGLLRPVTLADRLLRGIYSVPPLRFAFFLGLVIPYQLVRVTVWEMLIKGIIGKGIIGGFLRLVGLQKKQEAPNTDISDERLEAAGKKLLGPYFGGAGAPGVDDENGFYHRKLPGSEDGIEIHVVESGRREDPKAQMMLLVHGFPENHFMWKQILKSKLGEKYHLVALDLRGYGGSSRPTGRKHYTIKKLTADMKKVVEAVTATKENKRTVVMSHDWGGALSWAFTQRYKETVSDLIVINCPPASLLGSNMTWRQLSKSWWALTGPRTSPKATDSNNSTLQQVHLHLPTPLAPHRNAHRPTRRTPSRDVPALDRNRRRPPLQRPATRRHGRRRKLLPRQRNRRRRLRQSAVSHAGHLGPGRCCVGCYDVLGWVGGTCDGEAGDVGD